MLASVQLRITPPHPGFEPFFAKGGFFFPKNGLHAGNLSIFVMLVLAPKLYQMVHGMVIKCWYFRGLMETPMLTNLIASPHFFVHRAGPKTLQPWRLTNRSTLHVLDMQGNTRLMNLNSALPSTCTKPPKTMLWMT